MALCSLLISVSDNPGAMSHFIRLSLLSPLILASENLYLPLTEASENEWPRLYAQLTLLQDWLLFSNFDSLLPRIGNSLLKLQLLKTLGPMYINDALDWTGRSLAHRLYLPSVNHDEIGLIKGFFQLLKTVKNL